MIYTVTFNPAIDYVVRLNAPLQAGAVNRAAGEDCVLGGKGINVSGVLAQLDCPSVALGFVAGKPAPGWSAVWRPRVCKRISSICRRG